MLGYVIKKPNTIPVAKWALKTSVSDYSWQNSNPPDMIELSISTAESRTSYYHGKPPRTIFGTAVSAIVGDVRVHSSSETGVLIEIASIAAKIDGLSYEFRELRDEDFAQRDRILIPAAIDFLSDREIAELEKLFNKFTHSYMEKGAAAQLLCGAVFLDILARLDSYARYPKSQEKRDKYISYYATKARAIIDMRYAERITLCSVASELGITSGYLSTIFKKTVGVSFSEGLFEKRISAARELVCNTALSVSEIAEATGLGDESNLRRRFKQYFGTSIREYRSVVKEQTLYHEIGRAHV